MVKCRNNPVRDEILVEIGYDRAIGRPVRDGIVDRKLLPYRVLRTQYKYHVPTGHPALPWYSFFYQYQIPNGIMTRS